MLFQKIGIKNGYVFEASFGTSPTKIWSSALLGEVLRNNLFVPKSSGSGEFIVSYCQDSVFRVQ